MKAVHTIVNDSIMQWRKNFWNYPFVEIYAAFVAAFSFLTTGLLRSYTSPALSSMIKEPGLLNSTFASEKTIISWIASCPPLASFVGTIVAGPLLQYMGRRGTLIILTLPLIAGWLIIGFAGKSLSLILLGRLATGFAAGLSTASAQLYISECVRAEVRGTLGFLPAMMLSLGILVGFGLSILNLDWKNLALAMTVFPVSLLAMSVTIPESPSWLIMKKKEQKGLETLKRLRGKVRNEQEILHEISEIQLVLSMTGNGSNNDANTEKKDINSETQSFCQLMGQRCIWFPAMIAVLLMIFQQCTGSNVVIFYLGIILTEAEPQSFKMKMMAMSNSTSEKIHYGLDQNVSSVVVGVVQFVAFFVSLPLIDRLGRRILLISSALAMSIPHGLLGIYYFCNKPMYFISPGGACASFVESTGEWLPLTCLSLFTAAYSIGFGPICFILMSELFPSQARSYLCSLTSFINHFSLFILIRGFPAALDVIGPSGTFSAFALSCVISIVFVTAVVPETKGKSLAEIEKSFTKNETLNLDSMEK